MWPRRCSWSIFRKMSELAPNRCWFTVPKYSSTRRQEKLQSLALSQNRPKAHLHSVYVASHPCVLATRQAKLINQGGLDDSNEVSSPVLSYTEYQTNITYTNNNSLNSTVISNPAYNLNRLLRCWSSRDVELVVQHFSGIERRAMEVSACSRNLTIDSYRVSLQKGSQTWELWFSLV